MGLVDKLKKAKLPEPITFKLRPEILTHYQTPPMMHGLAPRVVLGSKWWDTTRKAAYKSTGYHCIACGVLKACAEYHKWLEGHESYRVDWIKGTWRYIETLPLCHFCHNYCHLGRLQALLERGEIHHHKFASIVIHGDRVLAQAGLTKLPAYEGKMAEWNKWRLCIGRRKYKPLFKSYEDWLEHFNKEQIE